MEPHMIHCFHISWTWIWPFHVVTQSSQKPLLSWIKVVNSVAKNRHRLVFQARFSKFAGAHTNLAVSNQEVENKGTLCSSEMCEEIPFQRITQTSPMLQEAQCWLLPVCRFCSCCPLLCRSKQKMKKKSRLNLPNSPRNPAVLLQRWPWLWGPYYYRPDFGASRLPGVRSEGIPPKKMDL